MTQANKVGHCREGSSDKVYVVSIEKTTASNGMDAYRVIAYAGRIWKKMKLYQKGTFSSLMAAESERDSIWRKKKLQKDAYVDIESGGYDGPLKMNSAWLSEYLVPELDGTVLK